jgi:S-adenosylmethionine:tRNA ribosyltransferase-isomerase
VMFLNDTKVLPARLVQVFSISRNGTSKDRTCEILYLNDSEHDDRSFEAMVYPGDSFPIGAVVTLGEYQFEVVSITYQGRTLRMISHHAILDMFMEFGTFPIPPYIEASTTAQSSYQTEFAKHPGSLAAPTASLHFTKSLLENCRLKAKALVQYGTLHVGIGTFKIINESDIREHTMHAEVLHVTEEILLNIATAKLEQRPVLAVGTTMVRYLESLLYIWPLIKDTVQLPETAFAWWQTQSQSMISANAQEFAPANRFRLRNSTSK